MSLLLMYERRSTFCHRCGILGYQVRECLSNAILDEDGEEVFPYGAWMIVFTGGGRQKLGGRVAKAGKDLSVRLNMRDTTVGRQLSSLGDHGARREEDSNGLNNP